MSLARFRTLAWARWLSKTKALKNNQVLWEVVCAYHQNARSLQLLAFSLKGAEDWVQFLMNF